MVGSRFRFDTRSAAEILCSGGFGGLPIYQSLLRDLALQPASSQLLTFFSSQLNLSLLNSIPVLD
jgi:hypothetical protein